MQALIKKGTEASPVWGGVRFQPNGWVFIPDSLMPHIFIDSITKDGIESLFLSNSELQNYQMITVSIIPEK